MNRARVVAALGALPALAAAPALAQAGSPVRMAGIPAESYCEPYYAADGGFFARAGINADVQTFSTGAAITTAVAGNALDVGIADTIEVGNAINHGIPFAYFCGGMLYVSEAPTSQLCVAANGPIKGPKDLEEQTIAVNGLKSTFEITTREYLRASGVDLATVKFVEIPTQAVVAAVLRGTVAAAMVAEPFISAAGSDLRHLAKPLDWCAKRFYINCWFAKREWLAANDETARKLVGALYATARWANASHAATAAILTQHTKLDLDQIRVMNRAVYATSLEPRLVQPLANLAYRYNLLDRALDAAALIARV